MSTRSQAGTHSQVDTTTYRLYKDDRERLHIVKTTQRGCIEHSLTSEEAINLEERDDQVLAMYSTTPLKSGARGQDYWAKSVELFTSLDLKEVLDYANCLVPLGFAKSVRWKSKSYYYRK